MPGWWRPLPHPGMSSKETMQSPKRSILLVTQVFYPDETATASILTEIDPDYCGALTLMIEPPAPICDQWRRGEFVPLETFEYLEELRQIVAHSEFTNCFFTSNHASNYLPLRLRLPQQKEKGVQLLDEVIASRDASALRPEYFRAL